MWVKSTAVVLGALALSGCEMLAITEDDCLRADWRMLGFRDGVWGADEFDISDLNRKCKPLGIRPNKALYECGLAEGRQYFCTPEGVFNAMRRAPTRDGSRIPNARGCDDDVIKIAEAMARRDEAVSEARSASSSLSYYGSRPETIALEAAKKELEEAEDDKVTGTYDERFERRLAAKNELYRRQEEFEQEVGDKLEAASRRSSAASSRLRRTASYDQIRRSFNIPDKSYPPRGLLEDESLSEGLLEKCPAPAYSPAAGDGEQAPNGQPAEPEVFEFEPLLPQLRDRSD